MSVESRRLGSVVKIPKPTHHFPWNVKIQMTPDMICEQLSQVSECKEFFSATDSEMFPSSTSSTAEAAAHIAGRCGSTGRRTR